MKLTYFVIFFFIFYYEVLLTMFQVKNKKKNLFNFNCYLIKDQEENYFH